MELFVSSRKKVALPFVSLLMMLAAQIIPAQKTHSVPENIDVNHVISEFTSGETILLQEFSHYGYKLEFVVQSIKDGRVVDEYVRVSQFVRNPRGQLEEKILKFVQPRTEDLQITREDLDNLTGPYQFALQSANSDQYNFVYASKERQANLDLYTFDVTPKSVASKRRLFHGRIWVAADALRIVKMVGRFEQKGNQRFPLIETYRDAVNNQFLFPAGASGDDELAFDYTRKIHVRLSVRYTDYVRLN